ncbi:hypothetical protein NDU88_000260 [Pleurodeles waltl]|uniref:Growth hormone secretagogue receptor type 1 n=1 Tax=Pleurodeles waltl TaxID=8319 RepID=A0AAV7KV55_PLEWA|nr:hypothetical protein NDU88_000260 [Pleurodeles waltl]
MCFTDDKIVNTAEELKVASFFCSEDRGNTSLHKDVTFYSFPFPGLCVVTVVCILLFVVGIVGNIMTILIISKSRNMRTTTNLYLSSIALSDVLILLCMPLDLYKMWNFRPWRLGDMVCKLSQYVSEACTYSTVLHITALSMERYLAVCYPLQVKVIITRTKIKWLIVMLWAVALSSAGPVFVLVGVEFENGTDPAETGECKCTSYAVTSGLLNIMMWVSSLYFFVPVCCLSLLYSLIGKKLWRRRRRHRNRSNTQTVKMLGKCTPQRGWDYLH